MTFKLEAKVMEQFAIRTMLPIISTQTIDGRADLEGTGFLFDDDGSLLLITAAHLYRPGVDLTQFAVPCSPTGKEISSLGSFTKYAPLDDDSLDVMAFKIESSEIEQWLRAGWNVLDRSCVSLPQPTGHFLVSGFPRALRHLTDDMLYGKPISIHTGMLENVPPNADAPVVSDVDFFLLCDDSSETLDGQKSPVPPLNGISGAPIWEYREPRANDIWSAETALKLVGISTSYRAGEYIRGKSWRLISHVLAQLKK